MNPLTLSLTDKIVDFIKRLKWKTYFFSNFSDLATYQGKEVFNLKTQKTPPRNKLLNPLENDLFKLIRKIKFRKQFNSFRTKPNKDIENIKTLQRFGFERTEQINLKH